MKFIWFSTKNLWFNCYKERIGWMNFQFGGSSSSSLLANNLAIKNLGGGDRCYILVFICELTKRSCQRIDTRLKLNSG